MGLVPFADPLPRRRWSRWRKILLAVIGLLGAAWLVFFLIASSDLNRAIAETEALDPGWRWDDIEAARAKLPDAENSAVVIAAGHKLLPKDAFKKFEETDFREHPEWRLTTQQAIDLRAALAASAPALAEFRKLRHMPRGRWPLPTGANPASRLPMATMNTRSAANALRYELIDRLDANDVPATVENILAQFNAGRSIGDEPFFISMLIRLAIDAMPLTGMERLLAQAEVDEVKLATLQTEVEAVEAEPVLYWGMRGERAWSFDNFEFIKSSPRQALTGPGVGFTWTNYVFFLPGVVGNHQAAFLRHMNRVMEITRQPPETWSDKLSAIDQEAKALPALAALAAANTANFARATLRRYASFRCMTTALAAERYRVKFGKWPANLDDLIAAGFLSKVPIDPFNGKPLQWKEVPDGRVIYSVGSDRVDHGGVELFNSTKDNADLGYRLFDPGKRRQTPPPTPPKVEAETQP